MNFRLKCRFVAFVEEVRLSSFEVNYHVLFVIIADDVDTVPAEILVRGPLALHTYNNALKEGKINVRRLPIMFIFQERSGKTSLKKSLKGDHFDANEESTRGIEVDPSHFKVTTEIWRPGMPDQTISSDSGISFDHHAARLIARKLKGKQETSEDSSGEPSEATFPNHGPSTSHDTQISSAVKWDQENRKPTTEREIPEDVANLIEMLIRKDVRWTKKKRSIQFCGILVDSSFTMSLTLSFSQHEPSIFWFTTLA